MLRTKRLSPFQPLFEVKKLSLASGAPVGCKGSIQGEGRRGGLVLPHDIGDRDNGRRERGNGASDLSLQCHDQGLSRGKEPIYIIKRRGSGSLRRRGCGLFN